MRVKDNKGFSLIELLICVAVIAAITVPLLNSFLTSHRVNGLSKTVLRATTVAQNEIETFKTTALADLLAQTDEEGNPVYSQIESGSEGVYKLLRTNVQNAEDSSMYYDMVITLDPNTNYAKVNSSISSISTLSSFDSGTYVETLTKENQTGTFSSVVEYYATNFHSQSNTTLSGLDVDDLRNFFFNHLKRTITINISKTAGTDPVTTADIVYTYQTNAAYVRNSAYANYSVTTSAFDNTYKYTTDSEGNESRQELNNIYLFYAPNDNDANSYYTTERYHDNIVINNLYGVDVNVFLICQNYYWDGTNGNEVSSKYKLKVTVNDVPATDEDGKNVTVTEGGAVKTVGATRIYTNVNIGDAADEEDLGAQLDLVIGNTGVQKVIMGNLSSVDVSATGTAGDRLYSMKVEAYEHIEVAEGESIAEALENEDPLVTLTGTKLEG